MIQWFFLDRVDTETAGTAITDQFDLIIQTLAHIAQATLALLQMTMSRAEVALQLPILEFMPISRAYNVAIHNLQISGKPPYFKYGTVTLFTIYRSKVMKIRPAAVAGTFYTAGAEGLRQLVNSLLDNAPVRSEELPKVLIVPHAGYVYSGATAAAAYSLLSNNRNRISRVVLLGPAHRVYLEGLAAPTADAFATPLGEIMLDREGIATALQLPCVISSDQAHELEHSLETQLPFLQVTLGDFKLLPLLVGHVAPELVAAVIDTLWGGNETLFVISTDLSHFHDYDTARERDQRTCGRILAGDTTLAGDDACGAAAVNGLLASAHGSALQCKLLAHCNSGDTAGDRQRVVGYGTFALH